MKNFTKECELGMLFKALVRASGEKLCVPFLKDLFNQSEHSISDTILPSLTPFCLLTVLAQLWAFMNAFCLPVNW